MTAPAFHCRYCRQLSDPTATACPRCGAPIDVRAHISASGWQKQPATRDMARIQFGQSRLQIEGTYVPVADFALTGDDYIYFSHHCSIHPTKPRESASAAPMPAPAVSVDPLREPLELLARAELLTGDRAGAASGGSG